MPRFIPPAEPSLSLARILAGVGLVFLLATLLVSSTVRIALRGTPTSGTVIDLQRTRRSGKPVVEFVLPDGRSQRFVGRTSSSPPAYRVGERIPVIYDPVNPADAVLDTFTEIWLLPLVFGCIGGGCWMGGAIHLARGLERRRIRDCILATGWRLQGHVASVEEIRVDKRPAFLIFVEARHPETGAPEQFLVGPLPGKIKPGRAAIVHLEQVEPHRYFAELL